MSSTGLTGVHTDWEHGSNYEVDRDFWNSGDTLLNCRIVRQSGIVSSELMVLSELRPIDLTKTPLLKSLLDY